MRRDIHESRTEDAGYRKDPERNTSPHLVISREWLFRSESPSSPAENKQYDLIFFQLSVFSSSFTFSGLFR